MSIIVNLEKSIREEFKAYTDYNDRAREAHEKHDEEVEKLYHHLAEEELHHYHELIDMQNKVFKKIGIYKGD